MGCVCKRVDVGHQLIAQTKVLFENRLGLFSVRPDFVLRTATMRTEIWLEGAVLEPANVELRIVVIATDVCSSVGGVEQRRTVRRMRGGQILPAANIRTPVGHSRRDEIDPGGQLALQRVPVSANIR